MTGKFVMAATLPHEVVLAILVHLRDPPISFTDDFTIVKSSSSPGIEENKWPNADLCRQALVCQQWLGAARKLLYGRLICYDYDCAERFWVLQDLSKLLRTLSMLADLAALVQTVIYLSIRNLGELSRLLELTPNVQYLLLGSQVGPRLPAILRVFPKLPNVRHLSLDCTRYHDIDGLTILESIGSNMHQLISLDLLELPISSSAPAAPFRSLRQLRLLGSFLSPLNLSAFVKSPMLDTMAISNIIHEGFSDFFAVVGRQICFLTLRVIYPSIANWTEMFSHYSRI